MKPQQAKKQSYTGRAVTIVFEGPLMCRLVLLDVKDGQVVKEEVVTNPDITQITAYRAEQAIWDIIDEVRGRE